MEGGNNETEKYAFVHSDDPDSLVMLSSRTTILHKLLKQKVTPLFIFICKSISQYVIKSIKLICASSKANFNIFPTVGQASTFIRDQIKNTAFYVIADSTMVKEVMVLMRNQGCLQILHFDFDILNRVPQADSDSLSQISFDQQFYHFKNAPLSVKKLMGEFQFKLFIEKNSQTLPQLRQTSNIVSIKNEHKQSKELTFCMMAMLNQHIDVQTRTMIIQELKAIKKGIKQEKEDDYFFSELKKNTLGSHQIVQIYSSNKTEFYKLINSFLRALKYPTELYYIQPFFKDLYMSIQQLDQSKKQRQSFQCFRGGFIAQKQIKNIYESVGGLVQNLSFMSTSLEQWVASFFIKNALFYIKVETDTSQNTNYGFADISRFSQYASERQILFNPMNYFKIVELTIRYKSGPNAQDKIYVVMSFGSAVSKCSSQQEQQESDKIQSYFIFGNYYNKYIKCQGDALYFLFEKESLNDSSNYWQKYHQICLTSLCRLEQYQSNNPSNLKQKQMKSRSRKCLQKKAQLMYRQGKYKSTTQMYQQLSLVELEDCQKNFEEQIRFLIMIGECYYLLQCFPHAIQIYRKCAALLKQNQQKCQSLMEEFQLSKLYMEALNYKSLQSYQNLKSALNGSLLKHRKFNINKVYALIVAGHMQFDQNRYEEAVIFYRKGLALLANVFGQRNQNYLTVNLYLANCLYYSGNVQQAVNIYKLCIRVLSQAISHKSNILPDVLSSYANALFSYGNFEESLEMYRKCVHETNLRNCSQNYIIVLVSLAYILFRVCYKFDAALSLLKYCRIRFYHANRPPNSLYFKIESWIAGVYLTKGKHWKAGKVLYPFAEQIKRQIYKSALTFSLKSNYIKRIRYGNRAVSSFVECL